MLKSVGKLPLLAFTLILLANLITGCAGPSGAREVEKSPPERLTVKEDAIHLAPSGDVETVILLDRQLCVSLGISPAQVATAVEEALKGRKVFSAEELGDIDIKLPDGRSLKLRHLGSFTVQKKEPSK